LFSPFRQLPQVGGQRVKRRLNVGDKSLAEDFPMLGFRGAAVPCRTTLQSSDQIVVQITHMQVPSHPALHETTDLNDLTLRRPSQDLASSQTAD
jgi:hypothetical protein